MKNNKAFLYFFTTLLILSVACRSGAQSVPTVTPAAPTVQDTATVAASPTAAEGPEGPVSLLDLYEERIQSGQWTEGEGLSNLLGAVTGSTSSRDVLGNSSVDDFELTGLLRLADQFLTNSPADPKHDEVQKQVNQLVAPLDRLEQFSRPHQLSAQTLQLVSYHLSPPYDTGDQETCQRLWSDGFSSPTPVICFEFDDRTVNGTNLRLYYPSWWSADDPRRARLQPFVDAASRAIQTFNTYGPDPIAPVTLVVTELVSSDDTPDFRIDAAATRQGSDCYVGLFPSMFEMTQDEAQQSLAHEMFHCYQYRNLSAQESGPNPDVNEWWVEGSAEYFSNVVYPSVNYEYRFLPEVYNVMRRKILAKWNYKGFIFFQYLENRPDAGIPGTLQLLRSMPTGGGTEQQLAALAAYPNMDVIFHEFAQAVVDHNVMDSNGSEIPLDIPFTSDPITEATSGDTLGRGPFRFEIRRVLFPHDFDYDLTLSNSGPPGRSSARLESAPHAWGALPSPVIAGCSEVDYILVVTQTTVGDPYHLDLHATSRPSDHLACSCLNGTWLLDDASYLTHLNAIIAQSAPGSLTYTGVTGTDLVMFTADGHVTQLIDNLLVEGEASAASMSIQVGMNGTSDASYNSVEGRLSFTEYASNLTITTLINNSPVSAPANEFASGPLGTAATYICADNTLTLTPIYPTYSDLPALTFTRQP